jgi:hypothetical protein
MPFEHFEFVNYSTVPIPVFANAKIHSGDVSQFTPIPPNTKLSTATCAEPFDGVYPERSRRAQDKLRRSMVWVSWGLR